MPDAEQWENILAFSDGGYTGRVIEELGAPSWIFTWDCVTTWWVSWNRPLRRYKNCLWYGDLSTFDLKGAFYGESDGKTITVQNSKGAYEYTPDIRGKHLADIFSYPITQLHSGDSDLHKHQKPTDWIRLLIGDCTKGDIYDPFAGSGTSIIACQQIGRRCFAVEIDPGNVAIILQRCQDALGVTPVVLSGAA